MRSFISFIFIFLFCLQGITQPTDNRGWYQRSDIENTDIGWISVLQFKEPVKPYSKSGWNYTAKQLEFTRNIASWMQQTYLPKGMLGEMKLSVYAPDPSEPVTSKYYTYNEAEKNNHNALPNTYGAFAKMYMLLGKTSTKKFWPINGLADYFTWNMMANNIELITHQMVYLSSPDEFYFTQPRYTIGMKGEYDRDWMVEYANYRNFTNSPSLKKYDHYVIPSNTVNFSRETYYVVIMTKDNKPLPFEQVTMGELISRLEKQLPMMYKIAINNGVKTSNLLEDAKRGLQLLKQRFSNKLNEFAYVGTSTATMDILDISQIEPNKDIRWLRTEPVTEDRGYKYANFPLLRLKKGVKEALAAGEPQWIVFRISRGGSPGNAGEIHMMETFMNRFNYDYVYDYYFGKDKVIKPYTPLGFTSNDDKSSALPVSVLSDNAKKMATDKSVLYFEDFSAVANGAPPAGWTTERSSISGDKVKVVEVNGVKGKWLKLKKTASPAKLSYPVSGDFIISFDVLTQKGDVPWGTPGMQLELYSNTNNQKYRFSIDVSPGDMNRKDAAGWVMIGHYMPEGYKDCKISNYYSLPDFTGSNTTNQVNMAIQRKGESMTVLCNNKKVFECNKAVPGGMGFNSIQFYVNEKNVFHISNVLLKKQ